MSEICHRRDGENGDQQHSTLGLQKEMSSPEPKVSDDNLYGSEDEEEHPEVDIVSDHNDMFGDHTAEIVGDWCQNGSLIHPETKEEKEALRQFNRNFHAAHKTTAASVYPTLYTDSLQSAIDFSTAKYPIKDRRMVVLYLNHGKSVASNIFPTQILFEESVASTLREHCILYPWDVTEVSNRETLIKILNTAGIRVFNRILVHSHEAENFDKYPMLLPIPVPSTGEWRRTEWDTIGSDESASAVNEKLIKTIDEFKTTQERDDFVRRTAGDRALARKRRAEYEEKCEKRFRMEKKKEEEEREAERIRKFQAEKEAERLQEAREAQEAMAMIISQQTSIEFISGFLHYMSVFNNSQNRPSDN